MKQNNLQRRIGIDLDNTIISYDQAFQNGAIVNELVEKDCHLNKKALRDFIRKRPNGEFEWQKLQGYVYGEGIGEATLFQGLYRFLWRCHERNIHVEIVSHKTEFGHFDKNKISLRDSATNFLKNHGLLDAKNPLIKKVTYKGTKTKKIDYIKENNFELFIDDLEEIIFSNEFKGQKGMLFSQDSLPIKGSNDIIAKSWEEISQSVLGDWNLSEVRSMTTSIDNNIEVKSIEMLKGRGNSAIYKINLSNSNKLALKIYPDISYHDRLKSEFKSTEIFKELNFKNVQRPVSFDSRLNVASYEWIYGDKVSTYGPKELKSALAFLKTLHKNSNAKQFTSFPMAADACPRGLDIEMQIQRRLSQFNLLSSQYSELEQFLKNEFEPIAKEIISWSKASWPIHPSYKESIQSDKLILSPSDFGFHNSLRSQDDNLIFHDFEYFGWDDPVKLISDFSHHAAMDFSKELEQVWFSEVSEIYGKELIERLSAAWPMYGLNWCLIILNEFKDEVWIRRCAADKSKSDSREKHLKIQLNKSRNKLNELSKNYKNKFFW
ncbi:hypothetical protein N8264_03370 [Candidatus Thioglobus sp.]|nr:hypothetical protein [Candidatus Thioglobus sp.]